MNEIACRPYLIAVLLAVPVVALRSQSIDPIPDMELLSPANDASTEGAAIDHVEAPSSSPIIVDINIPLASTDIDDQAIEIDLQKLANPEHETSDRPDLNVSLKDLSGNVLTGQVDVRITPMGLRERGIRARVEIRIPPTEEVRLAQARTVLNEFIQAEVQSGRVSEEDEFLTSFESNFEKRTAALAKAYPISIPGEYIARIELELSDETREKLTTREFKVSIQPSEDPISNLLTDIRAAETP